MHPVVTNLKVMRAVAILGVVLALALQPSGAARASTPDDPRFDEQWGLEIVGASEAWEKAQGEGVTIAVVDSGVDLGHEDLADGIGAHVSCVDADDDPDACSGSGQDDHGHGSHVAGIAAAATGNGVGVASVAPGATLMSVKVLEPNSAGQATGSLSDVRAGIRWAVDHGADVINLSLGENVVIRNLFGSGLHDAIEEAWEAGVIPVIAAGNTDGLFDSGYRGLPALVVAATTKDDGIASYSTDIGDARWGIAAPGGDGGANAPEARKIYSTFWEEGRPDLYGWSSGTSMAAPHVAGGAAMLLSRGFTPRQTVDRLLGTAVDLGPAGHDRDFGHGRLDLAAATAGLSPRPGFAPPATTTTTAPPPPPSTTPPTVAARQVTPPTDAPRPSTTMPPSSTTTSSPPETTRAVAAPVPDPPPDDGVGAWGVIAGTVLGLAVLGARGVWRRRGVAVRPHHA